MEIREIISSRNDIVQMLKRTYYKSRLSHAYLFNGEEGTGKKEIAYYFACLLYCKKEDGPCFECHECKSILKNEHLNVMLIEKSGQGIKKEQILDLQTEFSMTSLVDGPRIYIIDGIEKISLQAANSLLKFIEEPLNKNTYGILLTEDITRVLPTIISRSSILNFPSMNKQELTNLLIERDIEPFMATILPYLTNNINEALILATDEDVLKLPILLKRFLEIESGKDIVLFIRENNTFIENNINVKRFFMLVILLYEDIIKIHNSFENITCKSLYNILVKYASDYPLTQIKKDFRLILEYNQRLEYNVVPKIVLQQLLINLF